VARLHEYQGKSQLALRGVAVPRGSVARTPEDAAAIAETIGGPVVLKVQAWITGRKAHGGVTFADTPQVAASDASRLLEMSFGNFPVEEVLVEEQIEIIDELFVSLSIDDATAAPIVLIDCQGGSGIEDRAQTVARLPVDCVTGIDEDAVGDVLARSTIDPSRHRAIVEAIVAIVTTAKAIEARSLEVNPLVTTPGGGVVAADCRVTIDDYAVFRHPELGIEIARELDHPATELEKLAYEIESQDHRGTFYFAQLPTQGHASSNGLIGFHGAGGGGSMMSMDAATHEGFTLANFTDTSGNPSAAKVYRAARVILAQDGLVGYFGSGSGVASQEQFHSAYGLSKAFLEMTMAIPVVIRLGGNSEDRAVEILHDACRDLPAPIEGFKKDDTPAACATRFAELVAAHDSAITSQSMMRRVPGFVGSDQAWSVPIDGGRLWIDTASLDDAAAKTIETFAGELLTIAQGRPELRVPPEVLANKDSELIATEIELCRAGTPVLFVDLAIDALDGEGE